LGFAGGCAHGVVDELPTSPSSSATVTMVRLMITPEGGASLIAGGSVPLVTSGNTLGLGAWANYSDGTSKYVEATWTSSDPNVIAFDDTTIKAVSRGTATVTARFNGMSDTETFTVEPNMSGTWSGNLIIDQCAAGSGSMMEVVCDRSRNGILPVGTVVPMTFEIKKNGADLTAVAALGDVRGSLSGADAGGNYFWLKGDLVLNRTTATVGFWNGRVMTDAMESQLGLEVRIAGLPSHANVVGHFDQMTRR
jgi:hypothetical protein